ncbi:LytR/AlgR family response regulator transcription factor [Polaribacter sp. R77954]|uniref:LytR/AlgR family response regulator transcription factor n=1 Tax=Polaribacter sp. R77954 TaxID=3093870 RepID=UPI0037CC5CC8
MVKELKAYIVEDDKENIEFLKLLVEGYIPPIKIIGEATNELEFVDLLIKDEADIVFLDIELDESKTSLEIMEDHGGISAEIIVVSSSKEYALKAINQYDIAAYMIKPLSMRDLNRALIKAEKKIQEKIEIKKLKLVKTDVVAIPDFNSIEIVNIVDIIYLEAAGKYTIFHLSNGITRTVSKNLGSYIEILPNNLFFRIHHKFLVNITAVESIFRNQGKYCVLKNGKHLPIAKRRFEEIRKFLSLK